MVSGNVPTTRLIPTVDNLPVFLLTRGKIFERNEAG